MQSFKSFVNSSFQSKLLYDLKQNRRKNIKKLIAKISSKINLNRKTSDKNSINLLKNIFKAEKLLKTQNNLNLPTKQVTAKINLFLNKQCLEVNQKYSWVTKKIPNSSHVTQIKQTLQKIDRPIINADINIIYEKLKENDIIQKNKMKITSKKSAILLEIHEIILLFSNIAKVVLNYFSCCDNFVKVKSIVSYYIRLSLANTLKHKLKISSTDKIFKKFGQNLVIKNSQKKNSTIHFMAKHEINNWSKKFNITDSTIIKGFLFKDNIKTYEIFKNDSAKKTICDFPNCNNLAKHVYNVNKISKNLKNNYVYNSLKNYKQIVLCQLCYTKTYSNS